MKFFVTGATGFLGTGLVNELVARGHQIHFLSRDPLKVNYFKNKNVRFYLGDVLDIVRIEEAMTGCDYVFHLAGCVKVNIKKSDTFYEINVLGTKNVLETARKLSIKKMIITSTAGIFGPSTDGIITETTIRNIDFFNEYEKTKSQAEEIALEYARKGQNIVIVNPTRIYGPGPLTESNIVTLLIKKYSEGKWRFVPGNGETIGNYVYIDDVVQGHLLAMEKGKSGEKFILGGSNASYSSIIGTIDNIQKRKHRIIKVPISLIFTLTSIHLIISNLFGKPAQVTSGWIKKYLNDWNTSNEKAMQILGYEPTNLETGIKKTLNWLNNLN
jgi:farnesol dehydrogenase